MRKIVGLVLAFCLFSCGEKNRWDVKLPQEKVELQYTDISQEFFDVSIPLIEIQTKYPFFFDPKTEGPVWEKQRRDTLELAVYDSVKKVFAKELYKEELSRLFAYYKNYFPNEKLPQVFTYSSGLQNITEPVLFGQNEGMLFIALDGFLGENSKWYQQERAYSYLTENMTPKNIAPAVVQAIGREIIPFNPRQQSFVDIMIYEGKKLILADALLPKYDDHLKIGYSPEDMQWAMENEGDIWNYFVEQNLVFDTDKELSTRFILPAPFSKFLNEIETESPGRIGIWVGWQICRKYLKENPEVTLAQFIATDSQTIFKESKYKPKKGSGNYTPTNTGSKDELKHYED